MKGVLLAAAVLCASVSAATARADAPPSLFDGAGVFLDNPANLPGPWGLADALEANHFTWIAFHVNNGLVQSDIPFDWIDVLRAHGIAVGGWGYEDSKPLIEAVLADIAVRRYGLDFFIADAESPYEQTKALHGWARSKIFVNTFRSLEPTLPAALTTYGAATAPWVLPIDYASWRDAGFDLLPQAYYNQFPKAANYVPLLASLGTRGFSVFLADQATAADYAALEPLAAAASG